MSDISLTNTTAQLSGKTVPTAEGDYTITGQHTFDRDPSAPFVVTANSAAVTNLDADKLDGIEGAAFLLKAGGTMTGDLLFTDATYDVGKTGATRPRDGFFSRNMTVGGTLGVTGVPTFTAQALMNGGALFGGHLLATDATYDIGASGATRFRDLYLSRNAVIGGTLGVTGVLTAPGVPRLLKATDSTDTTVGAATVDSIATGALTAKDTIRIEISIYSATQATAGLQIYNATDGIKLGDLFVGGASAALNVNYHMTAKVRKRPGSTTAVSCYTVGHDAGGTVVGEWAQSGSITAGWVGGFTIGLRHTGVTAGGTLNYSWAVYLDPGQ